MSYEYGPQGSLREFQLDPESPVDETEFSPGPPAVHELM
jgi:hypothetical protein